MGMNHHFKYWGLAFTWLLFLFPIRSSSQSVLNIPLELKPEPLLMGGVVSTMIIDPLDNDHLFALQEQTNNQQSLASSPDRGLHWKTLYSFQGQLIQDLAIDPENPMILYAGSSRGIFRSENGGVKWAIISETGPIVVAPRHGEVYVVGETTATPDCPYGPVVFLHSMDQGNSWITTTLGCVFVGYIAVAPSDPRIIYLPEIDPVNSNMALTLASSQDSGQTWTSTALSAPFFSIGLIPMAVDPKNPQKIYSSSGTELIVSLDGGQTWVSKLKISGDGIFLFGFSKDNIFAGLDSFFGSAAPGLYRSDNGGETWQGITVPLQANLKSMLIISGQSDRVYIGLDGYGIQYSSDGGQSWSFDNNGLVSTTLTERIRFLPGTSQTVFSIIYWPRSALFKSSDGGSTWGSPVNETKLADVIGSPRDPNLVWAVGPAGWIESQDEGSHWENVSSLGSSSLAISPASPDRPCATYVNNQQGYLVCRNSGNGSGVMQGPYPIPDSINVDRLAINPTNSGQIFVGGSTGGSIGAIFQSEDSGQTWRESLLSPSVDFPYWPIDIVISEKDPERIIAVFDQAQTHWLKVYESKDGGNSWENITLTMEAAAGENLWDGHMYRAFAFFDMSGSAYFASGNTVLAQPGIGKGWIVLAQTDDLIYSSAIRFGTTDSLLLAGGNNYWALRIPVWHFTWFPLIFSMLF